MGKRDGRGAANSSNVRRESSLSGVPITSLGRFLTDGRVEIDNNTVEPTIRAVALNCKNALYAGHDVGAQNWTVITSLIGTSKMNGVDPHAWLSATLTSIVQGHTQSQIDDLLLWNYAITV